MHVGESATLHANIDHTAGTGPTAAHHLDVEQAGHRAHRPDHRRGDRGRRGSGGHSRDWRWCARRHLRERVRGRADDPVPSAATAPLRPNLLAFRHRRRHRRRHDDFARKAADALRESANNMVAALKAKDGALVTQLFGDGNNADAADLLKTMKDQFGFTASVVQINPAQMADRVGPIDYRITVSWVSAAGPTRTRNVNMRAEAEQRGDSVDGGAASHRERVALTAVRFMLFLGLTTLRS